MAAMSGAMRLVSTGSRCVESVMAFTHRTFTATPLAATMVGPGTVAVAADRPNAYTGVEGRSEWNCWRGGERGREGEREEERGRKENEGTQMRARQDPDRMSAGGGAALHNADAGRQRGVRATVVARSPMSSGRCRW